MPLRKIGEIVVWLRYEETLQIWGKSPKSVHWATPAPKRALQKRPAGGPQLRKSGGPELRKSGGLQLRKLGGPQPRKFCIYGHGPAISAYSDDGDRRFRFIVTGLGRGEVLNGNDSSVGHDGLWVGTGFGLSGSA